MKIKQYLSKYKEQILYLLFGILSTVVNYVIYFLCKDALHWSWATANALAWVGAVIFAYITNKLWVFHSKERTLTGLGREILLFLGARVFSLALDFGTMYLCMDIAHMDHWQPKGYAAGEFCAKTIAQIVVIIVNYIFSKWIIFRKKNSGTDHKEMPHLG